MAASPVKVLDKPVRAKFNALWVAPLGDLEIFVLFVFHAFTGLHEIV